MQSFWKTVKFFIITNLSYCHQSLPRRVSKVYEEKPTRHACRLGLLASKNRRTPKKSSKNYKLTLEISDCRTSLVPEVIYTPPKYYSDTEKNLHHVVLPSSPIVKVRINNKTNKRLRYNNQIHIGSTSLATDSSSYSSSPIVHSNTLSPPVISSNKNHNNKLYFSTYRTLPNKTTATAPYDLRKQILRKKHLKSTKTMENIDPVHSSSSTTPKVVTDRQNKKKKIERGRILNGKIIQFRSNSSLIQTKPKKFRNFIKKIFKPYRNKLKFWLITTFFFIFVLPVCYSWTLPRHKIMACASQIVYFFHANKTSLFAPRSKIVWEHVHRKWSCWISSSSSHPQSKLRSKSHKNSNKHAFGKVIRSKNNSSDEWRSDFIQRRQYSL